MSPYRVSSTRLRRRISSLLDDQTVAPVKLEPILAGFDAEVQILDLEADLSALLYQADNQRTVVLNARLDEEGQRFALARQIGHLALHSNIEVRVDLGAPVTLGDPRKTDLQDIEALEATWFALELLMPFAWIQSELRNVGPPHDQKVQNGARIDLQDSRIIERLSEDYRVAPYLLAFRLATIFD